MILRIIGRLMYQIFCHQLAPSIIAASCNCSGTDLSAARYMIRKNGEPNQTLTRMALMRAHIGSLSHGICGPPTSAKAQLKALEVGSSSQSQPSVDNDSGMTQGMSSMPRHLR